MIKPTIGRIVWFWEAQSAPDIPNAQPNAAIVTFVHSDELINITAFSPSGYPMAYSLVPLWQGEEAGERPASRHCEWMPYQKAQASKPEIPAEIFDRVEALSKKVAELEGYILKKIRESSSSTPPPPPPGVA